MKIKMNPAHARGAYSTVLMILHMFRARVETFLKFLCPIVSYRFTAIQEEITEWQKQDPQLSNKESVLEYMNTRDIGEFNIADTKKWMTFYRRESANPSASDKSPLESWCPSTF
jgi:hypothetical protein